MGRHGTIAGRKEAQDKKRGAAFTKYVRLITVAARNGADPEYNVALKHAIEKAKAINMPNDNITRAIKKGSGADGSATFDSLNYEGYGPGGVAVVVESLTDNRNRTASAVKSTFDKNGGNLGVTGCVSYMFDRKGVIIIEKTDKTDEDKIMEIALEAGMEDMESLDDSFYITTPTDTFDAVSDALRKNGYELLESDIEYVPSIEVETLSDEDLEKLRKLIDILEDNDDVQKVYHNYAGEL
ncbi:YebC/PmpR family DNA-binding transcriptional regulator [Pseudostreptobacillus sp.]